MEQLGAYIRCSGEECEAGFVETLVQEWDKVIAMADTVLRKISEEERMQALREDREIAEMFMHMAREAAIENGMKEGFEKGMEQGIATIARNLKNDGISLEAISKNTELTIEEIKEL